ncbi:MAG: insulinase family protein, partial [Deltaproteobacteria bacterium]|nr:insulinase family protein [Deltaproteobacteria bacterium]
QKRGPGQIASEIEALGGNVNAYTSWDRTVFHATVPSDKVFQGLEILSDAVLNPVIDQEELEKEKGVVLEEILEGEERPLRKSSKLLFATAYAKSPYRHPVIGYRETVSSLSREDLAAFRAKWYVPQNMFLLIVGDVDPDRLRPEIERLTSRLRASVFVPSMREAEPRQEAVRSALMRDPNARETFLKMAFHIPSARGADANTLELAADILAARESSRLVTTLKKEKALVHSISAHAVTPRDSGIFVVSATLDAKNAQAATEAVMQELQKLGKEPPSAEELQRAKISLESARLYERQTVAGIARSLGRFEADMGDAAYERLDERLNAAITADQVSHAVAAYLKPPNVSVTLLVPEK